MEPRTIQRLAGAYLRAAGLSHHAALSLLAIDARPNGWVIAPQPGGPGLSELATRMQACGIRVNVPPQGEHPEPLWGEETVASVLARMLGTHARLPAAEHEALAQLVEHAGRSVAVTLDEESAEELVFGIERHFGADLRVDHRAGLRARLVVRGELPAEE